MNNQKYIYKKTRVKKSVKGNKMIKMKTNTRRQNNINNNNDLHLSDHILCLIFPFLS